MINQSFIFVKRLNIYPKSSIYFIYQALTAKIDGNALIKKIIVNVFLTVKFSG